VIRVQRFGRAAGAIVLAVLVASCSPPDAGSDPKAVVTRTVTASPTTTALTETTEAVTTDATDVVDDETGAVPAALVGTWQSLDQGSAEDLIEIHADGSYLRAMVLMQQRPSGMFSYSIGTRGKVEVQGRTSCCRRCAPADTVARGRRTYRTSAWSPRRGPSSGPAARSPR
jgi:hypothetical protein